MNTALIYNPFRNVMRHHLGYQKDHDLQWLPKVDLIESKMNYIVEVELPGLSKQDISMNYENNVLSIEGEKNKSVVEEEKSLYRAERSYGKFKRTIHFGNDVNADKIEAEMKNGLLRVILPKKVETQARRIEIMESNKELAAPQQNSVETNIKEVENE